ncbi:hypothetical protein FA09DRAFT_171277 [Tilletiopsis washingtonensis]|uniref:Uncharacterized protein n=1 Tax=Tilletiopsis washingtonensis TaxID=58919 RepID=A0A316Z037_9BASI|nr:hypothetical protein FA09DRAFT_171277 [Tilletiopsis washingtonensis]PWN94646.1 hypothetical protein FA09DRAFT_171277 [Tilletiopsis washingtonensis]
MRMLTAMAAVLPDAEPSDSQPTPALALDADARPPLRPGCVLPAAAAAKGRRLRGAAARRARRAAACAVARRIRPCCAAPRPQQPPRCARRSAAGCCCTGDPPCSLGLLAAPAAQQRPAAVAAVGPLAGRACRQEPDGARRRDALLCGASGGREETLARRPCLPSFALVLAATRASGAGRRAQGAPSHPPAASRQPPPLLLHPGRSGRELPDGWAQGKRRLRCSTGTATQRRRRGLPTSCANKRRRRVAAPCTA